MGVSRAQRFQVATVNHIRSTDNLMPHNAHTLMILANFLTTCITPQQIRIQVGAVRGAQRARVPTGMAQPFVRVFVAGRPMRSAHHLPTPTTGDTVLRAERLVGIVAARLKLIGREDALAACGDAGMRRAERPPISRILHVIQAYNSVANGAPGAVTGADMRLTSSTDSETGEAK